MSPLNFLLLPLGNKKQAALSLLTYLSVGHYFLVPLFLVTCLVVSVLNTFQVSHLIGREPRS